MKSEPRPTVGFVGIGMMGVHMVRCIAGAGYRPTLHDIDTDVARAVAEPLGLDVAARLADLGSCDTVILMLPNSAIVSEVCLGTDGLADVLPAAAVIVDMSSSDPIETRKLSATLAERGIVLLDAPVSGGVRRAEAGTLSIMLGGADAAALDRTTPLLQTMGTIFRTGSSGSGHAAKALNNYVSAAGLVAACEAVIVGRAFGLDPETLVDVLNASTGRNNSTENKLKPFILGGRFRDAGFALDLMAKDVGLAAALAQGVGADLPRFRTACDLWAEASDALGQGADHTEIFRHLATEAEAAAESEAEDG